MIPFRKLLSVLALVLLPALTARAAGEVRARIAAAISATGTNQLSKIAEFADDSSEEARTLLGAWRSGSIFVQDDGQKKTFFTLGETADSDGNYPAFRLEDGKPLKDEAGAQLRFSATDAIPVDANAKLRKAIKDVLDLLALAGSDSAARGSAAMKLGMEQKPQNIPLLQARLAKEKDSRVRRQLDEAIAIIGLASSDLPVQSQSATDLARLNSISALDLLKKMAGATPHVWAGRMSPSKLAPEVAAARAVRSIEQYVFWVDFYGTIFRGLSLGSVLLVAALGLAITFGLMGVINMAHGELMVVGGYAAYVTQNLAVQAFGSGAYQWYFIAALPVAFLSAAFTGLVLERCIVQFLYKRPLESLLATWGVSLVLQQTFRLVFGSNNVQVNSPDWLLGSFEVRDVLLGYNRIFVIGFAAAIVIGVHLLLTRTSLGLLIRAVMQNRNMAACMGVRTEWVNMMTFALGSGLAGLAGAFLSQLGNVGPNLGQSYIVDCFMTVVTGGVGNLAGTVWSALGIGTVDQTLQPFLGPVMGKITVLGAIILFLQWKPAGLFAARSRSLEG